MKKPVILLLGFFLAFQTFPAYGASITSFSSGATVYIVNSVTTANSIENWTVPYGVSAIDAFVVGGGGGGGTDGGNGGGGGELRTLTSYATSVGDVFTFYVGNGGNGAIWNSSGSSAGSESYVKKNSSFILRANGGTGGLGWTTAQNTAAGGTGGTGGTGYAGGTGGVNRYQQNEGIGGAGSNGPTSNIRTGSNVNYGGGGGGGSCFLTRSSASYTGATGGLGGGGSGAGHTQNSGSPAGSAGSSNTGGGGGGGAACDGGTTNNVNQRTSGGAGGSGIAVYRYILTAPTTPDLVSASDTGASNSDNQTSDTTPTFTGTAIGNSSVQLYVDNVASGSACSANQSSGAWTCTTGTLAAGVKSIVARATISGAVKDSSALSTTIDAASPTYSSSAVSSNGTQVILTYSEALSATTAAITAFSVLAGGVSKTISSLSILGSTVVLTLSSAIRQSQAVSFTYTDPSAGNDTNAIQDAAGNDAVSRALTLVTNNSTISAAQAALSLSSNTSTKSYPYSQLLTFSSSGGSGSGDVTYAITSGGSATGCLLSSDTATVTISATSSGTCRIVATKDADGEFLVAITATPAVFTFSKATQSNITITSGSSISYGSNLALTSTGGSTGGTFTYTKVSGDCTVSGETLTPTAAGSCIIYSSLVTDTNYLAAQSANTTITIAASSVSASISLDAGTLAYRQIKTITATATVAGKVTFKVNGKRLPGCINKRVSALNSYIATCSYKPSTRGFITITTTLNPTDPSYIGSINFTNRLFVINRGGRR